ncbi:hypothetical protein BDF20DRAFT_904325 [Mycotypha africana]|uniref:uncharacterized protein n=1 Tax=Mycotypha africana TaxID=64632 RepID=UPI0023015129|nr:uncharacterized protein BDF20DRAFT_904325 [Mycotypha africana]KAI8991944.1 hypothetical protein BDF20DRAFT_904325 [Mycotypha africana]
MDPKLSANAAQGMNINPQQNPQTPNMMMSFQQQQQHPQPEMQQFNPLNGLNNMAFNTANMANLNYVQPDFSNLDPNDLNMNAFIQNNPNFGGNMNMNLLQQQALQQQQQQQQHLRQPSHPQSVYSPQNLMGLQGNSPAMHAQYQNRGLYQNNGSIMAGSPQALMFQQQQAAAMAMARAKQSPSQSPAMSGNIPNNVISSPSVNNSPHIAGARVGQEYAVFPMNPNVNSPAQSFQHTNGISPSPQMTRVIPSQANNQFMQQQQNFLQQQQHRQQQVPQKHPTSVAGSPSLNSNPPSTSYNSPQLQQQQAHQQSPIPRQSATPASNHSTPHQQHRQIDNAIGTPQMSPGRNRQQQAPTPMTPMAKPTTASYSPSSTQQPQSPNVPSETSASPNRANQQNQLDSNHQSQQQQRQPLANMQPSTPAPPVTPQQKIAYIPKTRNVDTYGGVDLKYFDKFEIKPLTPHLNELGIIDIQALIMSLKSGLKMEVTNALNVLTVLTTESQIFHHHHPQQQQQCNLPLMQCDDLLDVLLDYLEEDILGSSSRFLSKPSLAASTSTPSAKTATVGTVLTYIDLFDMSLDEMKSLIPQLEKSTSDIWMSLRERCLCIFNIIRNLSFMTDNIEYLARHSRFVRLLCDITGFLSNSYDSDNSNSGKDTTGRETWFVGIRLMDTLDFRKSVLMILSNISMFLTLNEKKTAAVLVYLVHDFLINGPDTYYSLLAIETWTKLTVNYENRQLLHTLIEKQDEEKENERMLTLIEDIWLELTSVIRRDFFSSDGRVMHAMTSNQLATLELIVMGLYNIVAIIQLSDTIRQRFLENNKGMGMMIMRLCITLAESGNPQFSLVTKHGMELIRALICGGDGIYKRPSQRSQNAQQHRPLAALSQQSLQYHLDTKKDEKDRLTIQEIGNRLLDVSVLREKLMLSMLKHTTDPEILRELSDIVALIDDEPSV